MNAPNFNFDGDQSGRLPVPGAAGAVIRGSAGGPARPEDIYYGEPERRGSEYRRLFFWYLGLTLKYRWLILAFAIVALAIGFIATFTATPIYRATATIQIDREAPKIVKSEGMINNRDFGDSLRFYQTQYDLLKSRSLAERVAANLDLAAAPDFVNPRSTSAWGKLMSIIFPGPARSEGSFNYRKSLAAGLVQGGLTIAPVPNSRLVRISYDSPSVEWAQKVANGIADNFISANLDRRYGATAYARNFLKERLDELKIKLEESERALVVYAEEKEILTGGDGKQSLADSDLTALNAALQKVTTDRIQTQEQWEQANGTNGLSLPQILEDKSVEALRARRVTLMSEYQDKLATFKPAYPDMRRLKAQIDQIDQEIKAAADTIKLSLKAKYESARQQEVLLRQKIEETKSGVLDIRNKQIQYNILKREADTNRTLYDGLLQQYKDVGVAGAVGTNNIAVIDHARRPGGPFKPNLRTNLFLALILGLAAAAVAIAIFEILDDTFKSPEEVEEHLGLAVLGIIPFVDGEIIAEIMEQPTSHVAEAYRSFRTALQFSTDQGVPKSILVTSARPGEGKSTTALALAANFAQLGMKVLLIDADLRNPSQHRNLKLENNAGLANYLAGATPTNGGLFQETSIKGLYFMSTGPLPPNPAELLAGPKMMSLLSGAGEKYDAVVIDAPPIMGLADAPLLASMASGTLLVMATADTRRGVVRSALKRLHFARARMVGAVMNKFDYRAASYGYGYGYGHGYGYGAVEHYGYGHQKAPAQVSHSPGS
jgi:capsular exopolysaccharide synthesis family protein